MAIDTLHTAMGSRFGESFDVWSSHTRTDPRRQKSCPKGSTRGLGGLTQLPPEVPAFAGLRLLNGITTATSGSCPHDAQAQDIGPRESNGGSVAQRVNVDAPVAASLSSSTRSHSPSE